MPVYKYKTAKGIKWYFSILEKGKRIKRTGFESKTAAMNAEREYLLNDTRSAVANKITLKELVNSFMSNATSFKPTTLHAKKLYFNKYITSYFLDTQVSKIDKLMIQEWKTFMNSFNLSASYKNKIYGLLKALFQYANEQDIIDKNPCIQKGAFISSNLPKPKMLFWIFDEFINFINTFDDNDPFKLFFEVLYFTGLRIGEIQALNWDDLIIERKELRINKSLTSRLGKRKWEIFTTKTSASNRLVLLTDELYEKLLNCKGQGFMFGGDAPYSFSTITRTKNLHCQLAGVKQIRLHDFRHSHASLLIDNKASPSLVAERLGHSNVSMTLNTYTHLFPNAQSKIINSLPNVPKVYQDKIKT